MGAEGVPAARAMLKQQKIDLVSAGSEAAGWGRAGAAGTGEGAASGDRVVVMTAFATVAWAVEAMRMGAGDYLTKPFALEELTTVLERAGQRRQFDLQSRQLRERLRTQKGMGGMIGESPEMEKLYRILSKVAFLDASGDDSG